MLCFDTMDNEYKVSCRKTVQVRSPRGQLKSGSVAHGQRFKDVLAQQRSGGRDNGQARGRVLVGQVTRKVPTVSELLYTTSYRTECWNILAEKVNTGKSFTTIPPGTRIFIDPDTFEISWDSAGEKKDPPGTAEAVPGPGKQTDGPSVSVRTDGSASRLSAAVRKFLGTAYSKMDCYELVVGGLKEMGIQYQGKGGLGGHLVEKAVSRGFACNHYLNGEGLTDATGSMPYAKRVVKVKNADLEAERTMADMTPFLRDGQILSFSTRTRGHTGVVSNQDNVWTFINSGKMDHNLSGVNGPMGVGEEGLAAEIKNWFRLAARKGEGLTISLGAIDMEKLAKFNSSPGGFTEKV